MDSSSVVWGQSIANDRAKLLVSRLDEILNCYNLILLRSSNEDPVESFMRNSIQFIAFNDQPNLDSI